MPPKDPQTQGYAAYRAGNFPQARAHFEAALALLGDAATPKALIALSDLGAACSAMGDHEAARLAHEQALRERRRTLGARHPDVAVSLHNLGAVHRAQGRLLEAEACHTEAVAIWRETLGAHHPLVAKGLASLCALAQQRGDPERAMDYAWQVLQIRRAETPQNGNLIAAAMDDLAAAQAALQHHEAARTTWKACISLLRTIPGDHAPLIARILSKSGISFRQQGNVDVAAACFAEAVQADPDFAAARHHLAAALTRLGRTEEARPHLRKALARQCVFVEPAAPGRPAILILAVPTDGNIPLEHLLPEAGYTRIWWFIGYSGDPVTETLPPHDVVFNAIGDAGMADQASGNIARFLQQNRKPLLNDPARVALTRRDRLPALLAAIPGTITPATYRIEGALTREHLQQTAAKNGLTLPLLLRPEGAHGGKSLIRIDDWANLPPAQPGTWYLTQFHETASPDGHTRKYRVIFVGGVPFPYHLAISNHWLVHYFSADMQGCAWKLAEEAAFLENPAAALGTTAMAALAEIGRTIDLDYCGIDFTLLPDGKILVFEANPTMLVHPEAQTSVLAFKNTAAGAIFAALREVIQNKETGGDVPSPLDPPS